MIPALDGSADALPFEQAHARIREALRASYLTNGLSCSVGTARYQAACFDVTLPVNPRSSCGSCSSGVDLRVAGTIESE